MNNSSFRLLLVSFIINVMVIALPVRANTPIVKSITINGDRYEYVVGVNSIKRFNINKLSNVKFLEGVAIAKTSEIAEADVWCSDWAEAPNFTIALLEVEYKGTDRSYNLTHENYLVTYKNNPAGGIIDGVLLNSSSDLNLASARYLFPGKEHFYIKQEVPEVVLTQRDVIVTRLFTTQIGTERRKAEELEDGTLTTFYEVNANGLITRMGIRCKSMRGNINVKDASGKMIVSEHNDFMTLGEGMKLIDAYTLPASNKALPQHMDEAVNAAWSLSFNKEYQQSSPSVVNDLKASTSLYLKNMIYRNPSLFLKWMQSNVNSMTMQEFRELLNQDSEFAMFCKNEIQLLKPKMQRRWWLAQFKAWSL